MAEITFKGNPIHTCGELPSVGAEAPEIKVVKDDLSMTGADEFSGKRVVLNIFPSIDTPTCATSVRRFNQEAANVDNTVVLCVSRDLPFAQKRFCGAENIGSVATASDFRGGEFGKTYGVEIEDGPLAGLLARAVVVIDEDGKVAHTELVSEIANEPDYDAALSKLK